MCNMENKMKMIVVLPHSWNHFFYLFRFLPLFSFVQRNISYDFYKSDLYIPNEIIFFLTLKIRMTFEFGSPIYDFLFFSSFEKKTIYPIWIVVPYRTVSTHHQIIFVTFLITCFTHICCWCVLLISLFSMCVIDLLQTFSKNTKRKRVRYKLMLCSYNRTSTTESRRSQTTWSLLSTL